MPSWIIRWLKDSFVNKNYTSINKKKNKIYIDRNEKKLKNLPQRDISNENEVKNYLLEKEFMPAKLSNMKFIDQINLFYNAQCVVGLHGAGFGNLAFCQPRTKVIELRSSSAGPMYENYSKKNNLDYYSIITESQPIYKSDYPNQQGSIKIEINQLAKIIEN